MVGFLEVDLKILTFLLYGKIPLIIGAGKPFKFSFSSTYRQLWSEIVCSIDFLPIELSYRNVGEVDFLFLPIDIFPILGTFFLITDASESSGWLHLMSAKLP